MLTNHSNALVQAELDNAKKASIAIGVVTKDGKYTSGKTYDKILDTEIGDCLFEIGSTTKTFTSLLLAKLVCDGLISLDEPIKSYKPEYQNALAFNGKEITFRHLSTHRSGLPREDMKKIRQRIKENKQDKSNPYKHFSADDLHHFFIDYDLKKEIDKKWRYSNIGVGLLGNTLAEILGATYEEAIQSHILSPLGMKDTFIHGTDEQNSRYVRSYNKKGVQLPHMELPAINGAGALKSSIYDMLNYLEFQMGLKESPLNEAIELTQQIHGKSSTKKIQMGLGWFIEQKKWSESPLLHHGGTTMGFHSYCGFLKKEQIGVVIFSTIQLRAWRLIKMLLNMTGLVNENIAESIFKEHLAQRGQ
ncbi:penicillin-binding protein [Bacillus freudenreichii]|nr:penicillin-binding protein [Bacillus freudenreichii]